MVKSRRTRLRQLLVAVLLTAVILLLTITYDLMMSKGYFTIRPEVHEERGLIPLIDAVDVPCDGIFLGRKKAILEAKSIAVDWRQVRRQIETAPNRCSLYRTLFGFNRDFASKEEFDFPLAYGVLAHNRFEQLLLTLSSFYEVHNVFCLSIPANANPHFVRLASELPDCFPNLHVLRAGDVEWASYEILHTTLNCMEWLVHNRTDWRYFQYLSGVDVALRTNLEMVRILRQWDGLSHVEVTPYPEERLDGQNMTPPLTLHKGSLSGIISREAAAAMLTHPKARELRQFLRNTTVADESFWTTALGNPDVLPVPGSFNATAFLELKDEEAENDPISENICSHAPCLRKGFVGRKQLWEEEECHGFMRSGSCVFGVGDVAAVARSAALVAHRFYHDFEPAAMICMLREVRRRRVHPDDQFDAAQYNNLPQIEVARGISYEDLTRRDLLPSS